MSLPFSKHYVTSKQHKLKFDKSSVRSKEVLELIHPDVCEASVLSLEKAKYFVLFIDDFSRRSWVYPIKNKSNIFPVFKHFKAQIKLKSGKRIKC